jgi:ketosteroid isomerase-like protein
MYFTTTSGEFVRILALLCRNWLAGFDTRLKASLGGAPERRNQTMKISHAGTDVHAVLEEFVDAHAAHDAEGLFALYSNDVVAYSLAPPLQQGPDTAYGSIDGITAWFAGFDGPVQLTFRDLVVSQDRDLAFAHTLTKMAVTRAGQHESIELWYRTTFGMCRIEGSWRIAHRHDSTPFYMDGSFRSATDLTP